MGVYIRGVEMPKSCKRCRGEFSGIRFCRRWIGFHRSDVEVAPRCPLIELPPHGDLIDRDKYEVFSYTGTEGRPDTFDDGVMFMLDRLSDAPTIIEAEEKTE